MIDNVKISDVNDKNFNLVKGKTTVAGYKQFRLNFPTETANELFKVVCIVGIYNDKIQVYPISIDKATAVETINQSEAAKVIAENGEILVVGEAKNIEVYTTSGALVSKNMATTSVAQGLYIVMVDGKATKVLVKN